ncbi:MAG: hypothetical protein DDT19_02423 [Syntrophomonadaceae bacterium]|nr:hypothetical protein [Bacillota bacterium]
MNQSLKKKIILLLILGISFFFLIFILTSSFGEAASRGRVVGRVLDEQGRRWQNSAIKNCGSEWPSSSQLRVSPRGGWGCNYDGLIGKSNTPYYYTSYFDVGTRTITLTPPPGYQCDIWQTQYYPGGALGPQGSGCSATIYVQSGDWTNHVWFYIKKIPTCTSHYTKRCSDNDLYWYDSCGKREEKYQECGSDYWTENYRCSRNWVQREKLLKGCASNACYANSQWENYQDCSASGKICQQGSCYSQPSPTADIKANNSDGPLTLYYRDYVTLSWTSRNANFCTASGDWSGTKATSGSETIQLTFVKTYTFNITCRDTSGTKTATDSVQVIVRPKPPTVITKPTVGTL